MPLSDEVRDWVKTADKAGLDQLMRLIQLRWSQINIEIGMSFVIGDQVEFDSKKEGIIRGSFQGIKRKNAIVLTEGNAQWTVPPGILRKVNT